MGKTEDDTVIKVIKIKMRKENKETMERFRCRWEGQHNNNNNE